jgi:hypothetical protein
MVLRSQRGLTIFGLLGFVAIFGIALFFSSSAVAEVTKRLILKDGSYQAVSQYEIKGDRVRYHSADREEWEELPKDLIDWKATDAFNAGRPTAAESPEAKELDKELEAELKAEEARTPEVAPGLRLPEDGGVVLMDTFKGEQQLVEISQNGGELSRNLGKNILRGALNPVASQKQSVELRGEHASVQAHQARPVIFISPPPEEVSASANTNPSANVTPAATPTNPDQDPNRFRIVRTDVKKATRVVGNIKIAVYGKVSQQEKFIEAKNEPMSGGWVKLTPVADLAPGEYAVVEMLGQEGMNLYVWDFGVNPNAPANLSAWKAVGVKTPVKPTEPVKLEKRN